MVSQLSDVLFLSVVFLFSCFQSYGHKVMMRRRRDIDQFARQSHLIYKLRHQIPDYSVSVPRDCTAERGVVHNFREGILFFQRSMQMKNFVTLYATYYCCILHHACRRNNIILFTSKCTLSPAFIVAKTTRATVAEIELKIRSDFKNFNLESQLFQFLFLTLSSYWSSEILSTVGIVFSTRGLPCSQ
ncbi:BA75_04349T0 [Komagataella pastoris]|uniref:BA75_04349T0 n=1 Tax=Komagataella pastoris TaxID=4922 RepID=A0A1B2JF36_PICPA|nr:BA75_04349T0 [Komagataella pastoris]